MALPIAFAQLFELLLLLAIVSGGFGCSPSNLVEQDSRAEEQHSTFQLTSNSMAPKLMGPHYLATCGNCGHAWAIAAETVRRTAEPTAICANCNSKCTLDRLLPGQQLVAKPLVDSQLPERLDCVVYLAGGSNRSGQPEWACKRVWGLPDETLEFRHGDLWVNGQVYQKTANDLRRVAVPIASLTGNSFKNFDREFSESKPGGNPADSALDSRANGQSASVRLMAGDVISWNRPVLDDYPEDLSTPRSLVQVDDLMLDLEFEVQPFPEASEAGLGLETDNNPCFVLIDFVYRGRPARIECSFAHSKLPIGADAPLEPTAELRTLVNPRRVCCGGWDGNMMCFVEDDVEVLKTKVDDDQIDALAVDNRTTRFSITVGYGAVQVRKCDVVRDLYLRSNERDASTGINELMRMGRGEYFVMGDNLPISIDSRNGLGNLRRQQIWGVIR